MIKKLFVILLIVMLPVISADSTGGFPSPDAHEACEDPVKMLDVSLTYDAFSGLSFSYEKGIFKDPYTAPNKFLAFDLTALYTLTDGDYIRGLSRTYVKRLGIAVPNSPKKYSLFIMSMINDEVFRNYMYIWFRSFGKNSSYSDSPRILQAFLFAQEILVENLLKKNTDYNTMNARAVLSSRKAVYFLGVVKTCSDESNIDIFKTQRGDT